MAVTQEILEEVKTDIMVIWIPLEARRLNHIVKIKYIEIEGSRDLPWDSYTKELVEKKGLDNERDTE